MSTREPDRGPLARSDADWHYLGTITESDIEEAKEAAHQHPDDRFKLLLDAESEDS